MPSGPSGKNWGRAAFRKSSSPTAGIRRFPERDQKQEGSPLEQASPARTTGVSESLARFSICPARTWGLRWRAPVLERAEEATMPLLIASTLLSIGRASASPAWSPQRGRWVRVSWAQRIHQGRGQLSSMAAKLHLPMACIVEKINQWQNCLVGVHKLKSKDECRGPYLGLARAPNTASSAHSPRAA